MFERITTYYQTWIDNNATRYHNFNPSITVRVTVHFLSV